MRWSAAQALSWIICQEPKELTDWTSDMGPELEAAQVALAEKVGANRVRAWGRPAEHAEVETVPAGQFRIQGLQVVVGPHGDMVTVPPRKPYNGPRWSSIEFDVEDVERAFPRPPRPCVDDWMRKQVEQLKVSGRLGKRDTIINDCMSATGCTKREAETAYSRLPDDMKRKRGRPSKAPRSPLTVGSTNPAEGQLPPSDCKG